ncbi:MAG: hypothetical protein SWE60_21800, partial [Thermodesulfobacteriota bacterium]|nr:hypothetical protein [Thermodesulfobacteriota bacterium]
MKSTFYRDKWSALRRRPPDQEALGRLARQIAYSFLDYYLKDCRYEEDYIDLLCEMTTFSQDPRLDSPGAQALFGIIVETLCDDFEELQTDTYNRVMAQVISYCRKIPAGKDLDRALKGFEIYSSEHLLDRIKTVRANDNSLSAEKSVRKILLLSRVTVGADVAITSIIIQRLAKIFSHAELVLIGDKKMAEVYGGNPRIRMKEVSYSKKGGLLPRLSVWHQVLEIIQEEMASCPLEETVLVDPDSRLSQLGILPLIPLDYYLFFDSRSDTSFDSNMSMAELTNAWLDNFLGEESFCYPKVWLPPSYLAAAKPLCENIRNHGARRIISVNFGVGGNPRKRVGKPLEEKLLLTLLQEPGTVILLDKGFGDEERAYADALLQVISRQGYSVSHRLFDSQSNEQIAWGVVGVQTRIGEIAALISNSDEFIGYD